MDYQRDEHRVHLIAYHLVWIPKRRKAVLVGDVAKDCRALIESSVGTFPAACCATVTILHDTPQLAAERH